MSIMDRYNASIKHRSIILKDRQVCLVSMVVQDPQEKLDSQEMPDSQDSLDPQELPDSPERQEWLAQLVPRYTYKSRNKHSPNR